MIEIPEADRLTHSSALDPSSPGLVLQTRDPEPVVTIQAWKATRSHRGAKKRLSSAGIACQNPACTYFGNGDEKIHAMVSCGIRGKTDKIRRWKCQACGCTVTERKNTALYHLKTDPNQIGMVMSSLANGLDPSTAAHIYRHDHRTINRWRGRSS